MVLDTLKQNSVWEVSGTILVLVLVLVSQGLVLCGLSCHFTSVFLQCQEMFLVVFWRVCGGFVFLIAIDLVAWWCFWPLSLAIVSRHFVKGFFLLVPCMLKYWNFGRFFGLSILWFMMFLISGMVYEHKCLCGDIFRCASISKRALID